jgi:UDPglucose 6-dehydrogenase
MTMTISAKAPIVVVGAGYVGLVTAVGLAEHGHDVWCAEIDERRLNLLQCGGVDIAEPGLEEALLENQERLHFVARVGEAIATSCAQLALVTVGTPPKLDGSANLTYVHRVLDEIGDADVTIVMKSTVPPGTGRNILQRAEDMGKRLSYVSCPEFLQEGKALESLRSPDRIVMGAEDPDLLGVMTELHGRYSGTPVITTDITTAEMIKHTANFCLATRISFANVMANICEEVNADVETVMEGIGLDVRIGKRFLEPGVGFGGSCLVKDVRALRSLAKDVKTDLRLADAVLGANEYQIDRVVQKLDRRLRGLDGAHVALLGLAFKPNTDDLRSSPAFALANALRKSKATLRAWDPERRALARAKSNWITRNKDEGLAPEEIATSPYDAMTDAHAVVVVTAWDDFKDIDWHEAASVMAGTLVIDGRNHLSPKSVRTAGLEYEGTGRESRGLHRPLLEGAAEG